jgi:hypothetical protein
LLLLLLSGQDQHHDPSRHENDAAQAQKPKNYVSTVCHAT